MTDFLASHDLPARWQGRRVFTLLFTRFDEGAFLDTVRRWRSDPMRAERLHCIAFAPLAALDSRPESAELARIWPMRVTGVHRLELDDSRVTLTLAAGDCSDMLPKIWARVDAFEVDASAAVDPKRLAKTLARFAADDATLNASAAVMPQLEGALKSSGFELAHGVARFAPRWRVRRHEPPVALDILQRDAIVIGAGLAGCAVGSRLASRGWRVTLIDRHAMPARDASGNPAGVFHPIVWRDDSVAARLTRAGFLHALGQWQALEDAGHALHRSGDGLLQIADSADDARALAIAIERFAFPREYVTPATQRDATRIAGVEVARGGWFFPRGGAVSPAAVCRAQIAEAGEHLRVRFDTAIARIERAGNHWRAFDANGIEIAEASVLVLANAHDAARLSNLHGQPTGSVRGQLTLLDASPLDALRVPVIGEGYAVPLGAARTLIGATYDIGDTDRAIRAQGHAENIERVAQMLPALARIAPNASDGRVAFRCVTSDRMPMIGQLADEAAARRDARALSGAWPLDLPRMPGLYGAFAFGSRGLVWATLAAELIASQIEGEPWPVERELAEAVDPARFLLRALRHGEFTGTELFPRSCG
jgi:tRNA 5-methylaminomethyl-2-thiouridine biosynthesis bifunctional protein